MTNFDKLAEWLWRVTQVIKLGSDFHLVLHSRFERSVGSNPTLVIFAMLPLTTLELRDRSGLLLTICHLINATGILDYALKSSAAI